MRKTIAFISMSLDGFVATTADAVDWLYDIKGSGDNGYADFYESVDTVILGRRTYEWILENADAYPYIDKKSFIVTKKNMQVPDTIDILHDNVAEQITSLKSGVGQDIWIVGGGTLITSLLAEDIIDELKITVAPRLLGDGIRLFNQLNTMKKLSLIASTTYGEFVELHYKVL